MATLAAQRRFEQRARELAEAQPAQTELVPATGETPRDHIGRRVGLVKNLSKYGPRLSIELASSKFSDEEITSLAQLIERQREQWFKFTDVWKDSAARAVAKQYGVSEEVARAVIERRGQRSLLEGAFGSLENIYRAASRPLGAAIATGVSAQRGIQTRGGAAILAPKSDRATRIITPQEAFKNVVEVGPGRSVALAGGLKPGTLAFALASGSVDVMFRIYVDPLAPLARGVQGIRLARRIAGAGVDSRNLFLRAGAQLARRTPAEIMDTPTASKGVNVLYREIDAMRKSGNINKAAIIDRWRLPVQATDEAFEAKSADELKDMFVDWMHGRSTNAASARHILRDVDELAEVAKGFGEESVTYRIIQEEKKALTRQIERSESFIVRERPSATILGAIRQGIKRPGEGSVLGRAVRIASESKWANVPVLGTVRREVARVGRAPLERIPTQGPSLIDKGQGREAMDRLGMVLGLGRKEIDSAVNNYLNATSMDEMRDVVIAMVKGGRKNLPQGMASELTQIYTSPGMSFFGIDDAGEVMSSWRRAGTQYNQPVLWSQLSRAVPLPDIRAILEARSLSGRARAALRGETAGVVGRTLKEAPLPVRLGGLGVAQTWKETSHAISFLTSGVWVPSVLIRVGWPLRVVGEEQFRMAAVGINSLEENLLTLFAKIGRKSLPDVPEEALANYGKLLMEMRPIRGIVRRGEKGFRPALRDTIGTLHRDPVMRYLAIEGRQETEEWLLRGKGQTFLNDYRPVIRAATGADDVGPWLETMESFLRGATGGNPALLNAVKSGKIGAFKIDNPLALQEISRIGALPAAAMESGELWRASGQSLWRRGTAAMLNTLGSKPTNTLSRSKVWRVFYRDEVARLKGFGVADNLVESSAREYAIQQTGRLLYDAAERSAFDQMVKIVAPFFPAWREVLERWAITIPAEMGHGLGHAYIARRVQVAFEALRDDGLITQDDEGRWVIRSKGLDRMLETFIGVKGIQGDFPLASANILAGFPFGSPVTDVVLSQAARATGAGIWQKFYEFTSYEAEPSLGPSAINRIWRGLGWGNPLWEVFNKKYQDALFAGTAIDWMRTQYDRMGQISAMPVATDEQQRVKEKALRDFARDAESAAAGIYTRRGIMGWLLPIQPMLYWPGSREYNRFWKSIEGLGEGVRQNAIQEFFASSPEFEAYRTGKSYRIEGEQPREFSHTKYWEEIREGNLRRWSAEQWSEIATGYINYSTVRREQREKLSELGTSGADWLRRGWEMTKINSEAAEKLDALEATNPRWAEARKYAIRAAADKEGEKLPDLIEQRARDFGRLSRIFQSQLRGTEAGEEFDLTAVRTFTRGVAELYAGYEDDERDLAPGPDQEIAKYFSKGGAWEQYWAQIEKLRNGMDKMPAAERSRRLYEIQEFRNNFQSPEIAGKKFPTPEEVTYTLAPEAEQQKRRYSWVTSRVQWLSPFQRKTLGLRSDDKTRTYFDLVSENEVEIRSIIQRNGWAPSSREAKLVNTIFDEWKVLKAKRLGVESEAEFAGLPGYDRLIKAKQVEAKSWERAKHLADAIWSVAIANDYKSVNNNVTRPLVAQFYTWLGDKRKGDEEFDRELSGIRSSSDFLSRGAVDTWFYAQLFFERD